jgi:hypothetical protein
MDMELGLSDHELLIIERCLDMAFKKYRGQASAAKGRNTSSKFPEQDFAVATKLKNETAECLQSIREELHRRNVEIPKVFSVMTD